MDSNNRLGWLACRFRRTSYEAERINIADDYAETVKNLIESGDWDEAPAPEDMLPDDWMPQEFFDYWMKT